MLKETFQSTLEYIGNSEEDNVAFASLKEKLNPTFRWCKFILTDDKPNGNKMRIPKEEFQNLINTGIFAPIKMAIDGIKRGHEESIPLGTITSLVEEGNQIKGIAALWSMERPEDVDLVKEYFDNNVPLTLSWELLYKEAVAEEDVQVLKGTILTATTLVGVPAYGNRTPILAVASQNAEENKLDELELAKQEIETLKQSLSEKETEIANLRTEKEALEAEKQTIESERQALASYKAEIEAKAEKEEKLAGIKSKFIEAGITKEDAYFSDNEEMLLALTDAQLDFMVKELVLFASVQKPETKTEASLKVPNLQSSSVKLSPKELGKQLRKS